MHISENFIYLQKNSTVKNAVRSKTTDSTENDKEHISKEEQLKRDEEERAKKEMEEAARKERKEKEEAERRKRDKEEAERRKIRQASNYNMIDDLFG